MCNPKPPYFARCRVYGGCADLVGLKGIGTRMTYGRPKACNGARSFVPRRCDQGLTELKVSSGYGAATVIASPSGPAFRQATDPVTSESRLRTRSRPMSQTREKAIVCDARPDEKVSHRVSRGLLGWQALLPRCALHQVRALFLR